MAKQKMKAIQMASWIATTVAGLHLGLMGAFNINIFDMFLGTVVTKWLYILIGALALYSLWHMFVMCKK